MKGLVVVVNRCQPAYLGCYGNDWLATPAFDRLAAQSVVFDQHFADRPSPRGARRSWRTGCALGASRHDLLGELREYEIRTALIADERSPSFRTRWAEGWQFQQQLRKDRLAELEQETLLGGTVQTAVEWIAANQKTDNWLLWLETSSLQLPWQATEHDPEATEGLEEQALEPWFNPLEVRESTTFSPQEKERVEATYAGLVSGADQALDLLLSSLTELGVLEDLLLLVTSDCGLPLGEHGVVGDEAAMLHEERVHLPLLLHLPGHTEAGRRVPQLTQAVDLFPTLTEHFGIAAPDELQGQSLIPVARGEPAKLREYACAGLGDSWSIRTPHWHFILPDGFVTHASLYTKPDDRWEVNDVIKQHPDVAEHLELALRRYRWAVRAGRLGNVPPLRDHVLRMVQ